ncbi:MAG: response regulator [Anaerolineaceae bacterium]
MPDGSGYTLCKEIRAAGDTPVITLSAKDEEVNIIMGLDLGADDHITKPFRLGELISHIKAVLRCRQPAAFEERTLS